MILLKQKIVYVLFLSAIVLLGSNCSFNTVYNNLDSLIPLYIENLVELEELDELVEKEVIDFLAWHQRDQLPKYSDWLKKTRVLVTSFKNIPVTVSQIASHIESTSGFWQQLRLKLSADLARLLPLLSDQQVDELFASLEDNNAKYINENVSLSLAEKQKLHSKRLIEQFEYWLGYLTDNQLQLLEKSAAGFKSLALLRLNARLEWQRETRQLLISDHKDQHQALLQLFNRLSIKQDKRYKEIEQFNRQHLSVIISQILSTLDKKQEQNITKRLTEYIDLVAEFGKRHWK